MVTVGPRHKSVDGPIDGPTDPSGGDDSGRAMAGGRVPAWIETLVTELPDRIGLLFVCCCLPVSALLLTHHYNPYLAIVLTVVLFALSWPLAPRLACGRHTALGSIVSLEIVVGWIWVNRPYFQQMLAIARDPSIYAVRGWWLTHHSSPMIDMTSSLAGANGVTGASVAAGGFPIKGHEWAPQAASLIPGLIAIPGRIGGLRVMLGSNLIIGAVALLAVYGVARRLMGPIWGLVPMVALALSMPMIYFSRASYTEPTALAGVFIGLIFLITALRTGKWYAYLIAGLSVGIATLARADGILAVDGGLFAAGVALILTVDPRQRAVLRRGFVLFAVGGMITNLAGWYDLKYDSPAYYPSVSHNMKLLLLGMAVIFVVGLGLSFVPIQRLREAVITRRLLIAKIGGAFIALVCIVMASRPLWWKGHFTKSAVLQHAVADRQKLQGLPIDGTRSYDEHTVNWLAWYLGWPTVVLAAVGLTLLAVYIVRRRDRAAMAFFGLFGLVAILYMNDVDITPDQIWASRRLLPVIIPGVALAAAYTAYRVGRSARWRWLGVALAVGLAMSPALQWRGLFSTAEYGGELNAMNSVCGAISAASGGKPAHTIIAGGTPSVGWFAPPIKAICNSDVVELSNPTPEALVQIQSNWGNAPVTVVMFSPSAVQWTATTPPPARFSGPVTIWGQTLTGRPTGGSTTALTIWMGTVSDGGMVAPLS